MTYIRSAGLNERRCIARDTLGLYGSVVTVATYSRNICASSIQLSTNDLARILKTCICEHPVLSTVIQNAATEKPLLASAPQINLQKNHIRIVNTLENSTTTRGDASIQTLLEHAHNEPFTDYPNIPPWRIYIMHLPPPSSSETSSQQRFHLAFAISHALADGSSGPAFHSTFSQALRKVANIQFDSDSDQDMLTSIHRVLPPLEVAARLAISWSFLLRPAMNEFLPSWVTGLLGVRDAAAEGSWCGAGVRPTRNDETKLVRTAVMTRFVKSSMMQRVLDVCKSHSVRFTGLVTHLTARSLAQALRSRNQENNNFRAEIAIDLRKCIPDAVNQMANYVSATTVSVHTSLENLAEPLTSEDWDAIRRTTSHLAERSSTLADQPTALLKYLPNIRAWVVKQAAKPSSVSFGVSNLGMVRELSLSGLSTGAGEDWIVEDVVFSQSADGMGPPFNLNVASLHGGGTALTITWWPGMLGVEDEETFVEGILSGVVGQISSI